MCKLDNHTKNMWVIFYLSKEKQMLKLRTTRFGFLVSKALLDLGDFSPHFLGPISKKPKHSVQVVLFT